MQRISFFRTKKSQTNTTRQNILSWPTKIVIVVLLACCLIILDALFPLPDLIQPTTGTTLAPAQNNLFYFQAMPSWGKWKLDGKELSFTPIYITQQPLAITTGKHMLTWQAEPFQGLQCILYVPIDQAHQTCVTRSGTSAGGTANTNIVSFATMLDLNSIIGTERQNLLQATQAYLDTMAGTEIMQAGEAYRYNTTTSPIFHAQKDQQAHLRFLLDTNTKLPSACTGPLLGSSGCTETATNSDCRLFCTLPWVALDSMSATTSWNVAIVVRPTWTYQEQATTSTETQKTESTGDQELVTVSITWQQQSWHLAAHAPGISMFDDPNCLAPSGQVPNLSAVLARGNSISWTYTSGQNRAIGCLIIGKQKNQPEIDLLWRFDMLLAMNSTAHTLLPTLPEISQAINARTSDIREHPVSTI